LIGVVRLFPVLAHSPVVMFEMAGVSNTKFQMAEDLEELKLPWRRLWRVWGSSESFASAERRKHVIGAHRLSQAKHMIPLFPRVTNF
jgi:hypothetical protein